MTRFFLPGVLGVAMTALVFSVFMPLVLPVSAQDIPLGLDEGLQAGEKAASEGNLPATGNAVAVITTVINFILGLIGVVAVLFLIIAGAMYITAFGDENKASKAKRMILYVVMGLIIIVISAIIVNLVLDVFQHPADLPPGENL